MEANNEFQNKFDYNYNLLTRKLLRLVSENARFSVLELSARTEVSRRTVSERLIKAEESLGIRYTVEFNEEVLGLKSPHLILVKFTKKPDYEYLAKVLASSYIPQLVLATKGKYDLLIYANAVSSAEYVRWDKRTQIMLSKYGVLWYPSDVAHKQLGYFPLRDELIDRLDISQEHKAILKLLNRNSRVTFSEISKTIKMHFNTVAYNFKKIMQKGYVKRFTISADQPKGMTLMLMFSKYVLADDFESDSVVGRKEFTTGGPELPAINRTNVCAQLVGSYDFFSMGLFDNYESAYQHAVLNFKRVFKKHSPKVEYAHVDRVLLGRLPLRSVDTKNEYNIIKWNVDTADEAGMRRI